MKTFSTSFSSSGLSFLSKSNSYVSRIETSLLTQGMWLRQTRYTSEDELREAIGENLFTSEK